MMRMEVRSVQMPRWVVPILILAALSLIPFALMLALTVGGIAIGASTFRFLLAGPQARGEESRPLGAPNPTTNLPGSQIIDVEHEVKEQK